MPKFIDTHIHLQDFKPDYALKVLDNPNIERLFLASAKTDDFDEIAELTKKYPSKIIPSFGVHPWYYDDFDEEKLCRKLEMFPQALVGEIGVDGLKSSPIDEQHRVFFLQLQIAIKYQRPVIVHGAKAFEALKTHKKELLKVKYIYHGFVKNQELLKFINQTGGYIGLGRLFLKQKNARELWALMPKDKVLFETDAPYQTDAKTYNEAVAGYLEQLAQIADMSADETDYLLRRNACAIIRR